MNKNNIVVGLIIVVLLAGGIFAAVQGGVFNFSDRWSNNSEQEEELDLGNLVVVPVQFPGENFMVDFVNLTQSGFVVVYEELEGNPGVSIGSTALYPEGMYSDFQIPLTRATISGENIYIILHEDSDGDGVFNLENDRPLLDENGNQAMTVIQIGDTVGMETNGDTEAVDEGNVVTLVSGDYFFNPSNVTAQAGEITIVISDNSGIHTFVIDELGVNEVINTGTTFTFTAEPGTYRFYCDVSNHEALGMVGTLVVE
jgi:plastocyanin